MSPIKLREYMLSEAVGPVEELHSHKYCNSCNSCNVGCKGLYYSQNCRYVEDSSFCRRLEGTKGNPKRHHICNVDVGEEAYNKKVKEIINATIS